MAISNSWRYAYQILESFTANHRSIEIDASRVTLPDDVRGEFYQLFDMVTAAFVKENDSALSAAAIALADSYCRVEQEVRDLFNVQGARMPNSLELFLHHPAQALASALFDELFDLLQKKIDSVTFEQVAKSKLDVTVGDMCRLGYSYWVPLSLVRLLEPDEAFHVGLDSEAKPILRASGPIIGDPPLHPTLRLPELVLHSPLINKYIALKLELSSEIGTYTTDNRAERKQGIRNCGKTYSASGDRALLLYVLASPEEIPIVADLNTRRVSPPDVIVECLDKQAGTWDTAQLHSDILHPKQGTFVVLKRNVLPHAPLPSGKNIHPLVVGLDSSRLLPVVKALTGPRAVPLPM